MEVGLSILLEQVVKFVVNNLELEFFCLFLPLNFKPYFIMSSKVITEDMLKSSGSVKNPIILVVISNYPFSNGGYLVSFSQVESDGSSKSYDPAYELDFEASKLSTYLDTSSIFLPLDVIICLITSLRVSLSLCLLAHLLLKCGLCLLPLRRKV